MEYKGNAIYDYVTTNRLDYFFLAEHNWMLVYGDAFSTPKLFVFVSRVDNILTPLSTEDRAAANVARGVAGLLRLPFLVVQFMANSDSVAVWWPGAKNWKIISYDALRDLYEKYGVVRPGTPKKGVNQYVSSPYHDWQRKNLGAITVCDLDLLKYRNGEVQEIIELKRSKISLDEWTPFSSDYPNFALLMNAIVGSGKKIPFRIYYNVMYAGAAGNRQEDISRIRVFDAVLPNRRIGSSEVKFQDCGIFAVSDLLD